MNSYMFFQNKKCKYFPCHKNIKKKDFNCIFCYCPLYALKNKCMGNFLYLENGVKDCSNCNLPHLKNNYHIIIDNIKYVINISKITD